MQDADGQSSGPNVLETIQNKAATAYILSLGGFVLAQLLASGTAAEACNTSQTPAPPPVMIPDVNGKTFGPNPPPFLINLSGQNGCPGGSSGNDNSSGDPGYLGQPAGMATLNIQGVNSLGYWTNADFDELIGAPILANGGPGGNGGASGALILGQVSGGNGGIAGAGGSLTGSAQIAVVQDTATNVGVLFSATGGQGGAGGSTSGDGIGAGARYGGDGAAGAAGGTIKADLDVSVSASNAAVASDVGLSVNASGGGGGEGGIAMLASPGALETTHGGQGGAGAAGGTVNVSTSSTTSVQGYYYGARIVSFGGFGAEGGQAQPSDESDGGAGGAGGTGGNVIATLNGAFSALLPTDPSDEGAVGVSVEAQGGDGGKGGLGGNALGGFGGAGGKGGLGGVANLTFLGAVTAQDEASTPGETVSIGLHVQANGGFGGYGAQTSSATGFGGNGGQAGNGGTAILQLGQASASDPAKVTTEGGETMGAIVQSIGGGGGVGGDANDIVAGATLSVGGNGGAGGVGGTATATLDPTSVIATMSEKGGGGLLVQSIGGAGGAGGNATAKGLGIFSMAVGGESGQGAPAGTARIDNAGLVTTYGDHASGLRAQSIGGGGGVAGVAVSKIAGIFPTAAVAVGGKGASGGAASTVNVDNSGQVITYGSDAFGISAQSIGGGGGTGGSAVATAVDLAPSEDVPAISVSYAAGGEGGTGNVGGDVSVNNSGFVVTAGHGAMGVKAQSVGGGGGHAGDATAASWTIGQDGDVPSVDLSVALGGSGGTGGAGGSVGLENSGLLYTTGQDAHAVFAQSVGGGGGTGGIGDSSASAVVNDYSFAMSFSLGGSGGSGGVGGDVTLRNDANALISTRGDAADGVFAQSVGGGGGEAGGGSASSSGGSISLSMGIGGNGGSGGHGGDVTLENDGQVATIGTDSMGLTAQSVGGGGGRAGKAGATAGGADDDLPLVVGDQVANAFGLSDAPSTKIFDGVFQLNDRLKGDVGTVDKLYERFSGPPPKPDEKEDSLSLSIAAGISLGGKGGAAGDGGDVSLANKGDVLTGGAHADGMYAQSVGGGGGMGGASLASGTSSDDTSPNFALSLGGAGGSSGKGGDVLVTNSGSVQTRGVGAFGMVAQSVGGGGGRGGGSQVATQGALGFSVGFGGDGGAAGDGGSAEIDLGCASAGACVSGTGNVTTTGKHAVGLLAQSVGGGGGLVRTLTTDQQGDQSDNGSDDDPDVHNMFLAFGFAGNGSSTGDGGTATIKLSPGAAITTSGRNAHGVVATSIGGGGGAVGGGVTGAITFPGTTNVSGAGGDVTMTLSGASVATSGTGAVGLWASSIGGGGGALLGDVKKGARDDSVGGNGDSGDISIALVNSSVSSADGIGIIAHSIAGGGFSSADGGDVSPTGWDSKLFALSSGGQGSSGSVSVSVTDSSVNTADQSAIVVGSDARPTADIGKGAANPLIVTVTQKDAVTKVANASATHATISYINESSLQVLLKNSGTIVNSAANGFAAASEYAGGLKVTNSGTITGNIAGGANSAVSNQSGGVLAPYSIIDLGGGAAVKASVSAGAGTGVLRNAGLLEPGGSGRIGTTRLLGDLVQEKTGKIRFDIDDARGRADVLEVSGSAALDGGFTLNPTSLMPGPRTLLTAKAGLSSEAGFLTSRTSVFIHRASIQDGVLSVATNADFVTDGADNDDRRSLAGHLQAIWDGGANGLERGFATLNAVDTAKAYTDALDAMAGGSVAAVGYGRYIGGLRFADLGHGCPTGEEAAVAMSETGCGWLRFSGTRLERDATSDDPGFDLDSYVTAIGGERRLEGGWAVNGALGWETSDLSDPTNKTSVDGDAAIATLGVSRVYGSWTFRGAFEGGFGWYDSQRTVSIGSDSDTAYASQEAWNIGLHGRAAYRIPRSDGWYVEPMLDLDLVYVNLGAYTEKGAGDFDLDVNSASTTIFAGTPWIRAGRAMPLKDGGSFEAFGAVGATLSTGEDFDVSARFAKSGLDGFTTTLNNPNASARILAGIEVLMADRLSLRLQYQGAFAENETVNGGALRISYSF